MLEIIKKAIELIRPDLRHYYRIVKKARVVKVYASDGNYWADVQPLRNDGSMDENEPIVPQAELPSIWGGSQRGIVCPPQEGVICDLAYYDGDPNYPFISNIRWEGGTAPEAKEDEFVIQHSPGAKVWFDADGQWHVKVPGIEMEASTIKIKASTEHTGNTKHIGNMDVLGSLNVTGSIGQSAGAGEGDKGASMTGNLHVVGNITATGTITDGNGGTTHAP